MAPVVNQGGEWEKISRRTEWDCKQMQKTSGAGGRKLRGEWARGERGGEGTSREA